MSEKKPVPTSENDDLGMIEGIVKQLRLVWLLLMDKDVSIWAKLVVPFSVIYLISPLDVIPDVLIGMGQLDDLGVILLGIALFVKLAPQNIVENYRHQLEYGDLYEDGPVVDTSYQVVDEDENR